MTDPRQTSRDSATSARSKRFTDPPHPEDAENLRRLWESETLRPAKVETPPNFGAYWAQKGDRYTTPPLGQPGHREHTYGRFGTDGPYWCGVCGEPKPPLPTHVVIDPSPLHHRITGHGIGWLVGLIVGLLTIWVLVHGGHL